MTKNEKDLKEIKETRINNMGLSLNEVNSKLLNSPLSIRALWTSYDYLTM